MAFYIFGNEKNHRYEEIDSINSVQSSLISNLLWVTLLHNKKLKYEAKNLRKKIKYHLPKLQQLGGGVGPPFGKYRCCTLVLQITTPNIDPKRTPYS